jgi:hydrogenase maturation protease
MILLVAIGNTLRRDDGAAHRVLELLGPDTGYETLACHQLLPEMAEDMAAADLVIFIDADLGAGPSRLEPLQAGISSNPLGGHFLRPEELVALSNRLFNFKGSAWLCRVPGEDFGDGQGLSRLAEENCRRAAHILLKRLELNRAFATR